MLLGTYKIIQLSLELSIIIKYYSYYSNFISDISKICINHQVSLKQSYIIDNSIYINIYSCVKSHNKQSPIKSNIIKSYKCIKF